MKGKFDKENPLHRMILAGMAQLVRDEDYTPHEVFDLLEDMKNKSFHALAELRTMEREES
jgi:hypothetical protein